MIVNKFSDVVMSSLFGELIGNENSKGISHLALGSGRESWNSGTIPSVVASDSGLYAEFFRTRPSSIYFLTDVVYSGTDISVINDSGLRVTESNPYPNDHFNGLEIVLLTSTSGLLTTIVDDFISGTNEILFDSDIIGLNSVISGTITDVVALAGDITTKLKFQFDIHHTELDRSVYREESLVGGNSTDQIKTGSIVTLNRFRNRVVGGLFYEVHRDYILDIGSGFFIT